MALFEFRSPAAMLERSINSGDRIEKAYEAIIDLLESAQSNGVQAWDLIDTISGTVGVRDVVYHSPGDRRKGGGSGDCDLFVRLTEGATTILALGYQDWSTSSHTGSREFGGTGNGNSQWTLMSDAADADFWGLANCYGLSCGHRIVSTKLGRSMHWGNPIRTQLMPTQNGRGRLSSGVSSGATTFPLDRSLVGRLRVGQKIWVYQTTPIGQALVSPTIDLLTVDSVSASQVVTTAGCTQDLAAGALIGLDPSCMFISARVGGSTNRTFVMPNISDGTYTGPTSHLTGVQAASWEGGITDAMQSPDRWGRFIGADGTMIGTNTNPCGFRGSPELFSVIRARDNGTTPVTQFEPYEENFDAQRRYRIHSDYRPAGWYQIAIGPAPWTGTKEGDCWIRRELTESYQGVLD